MKKIMLVLTLCIGTFVNAQTVQKKSIAVANPYIENLNLTTTIAAKLMQLELIKIDKFSVYDEFDMAEIIKNDEKYSDGCYGISCLSEMGSALKVDYVISGSFIGLSNKIVISLKWIDVKSGTLYKSMVKEFDNQESEVQRMVEILLKKMNDVVVESDLENRLKFKNEIITSNNVGRINNSGPRVGYAGLTGGLCEFASRDQSQGGLDIFPGVSMIGYQLEKQYVGTENFSALLEGIFNISGMEQGTFLPSITILNGFRFGKQGWEFAFGPGFGLRKMSTGYFDVDGVFGEGNGHYFTRNELLYGGYDGAEDIEFTEHLDSRGNTKLSTNWLFACGRTFKAGALNIPVNVFYSSSRKAGMVGLSVGFNVLSDKKNINSNK